MRNLIDWIVGLLSGSNERTWLGHYVEATFLTFGAALLAIPAFTGLMALSKIRPARAAGTIAGGFGALLWNHGFWTQRELVVDFLEKVLSREYTWAEAKAAFKKDGANDYVVPVFLGGVTGVGAAVCLYMALGFL